ncbi:hypothetical protein K8R42_04460, partial [bacterium]|nr:hypothetical protein [bacterium]
RFWLGNVFNFEVLPKFDLGDLMDVLELIAYWVITSALAAIIAIAFDVLIAMPLRILGIM